MNDFRQAAAILIKLSQQADPELTSPEVKVEPADTYIAKAIALLKQQNNSFFVGVRKVVVDQGGDSSYGHVSSGGDNDPTVIHINLSKIKSELKSKLQNVSQDQFDKELIRQIALVLTHEKMHQKSFSQTNVFAPEYVAEQGAADMAAKIDKYNK